MATSSATIYNQSQLAERKHVARYWSINTAATAVPLSAHPSPIVITTKLAAAILGGRLFGGGVLPAQYCPCGWDIVDEFVPKTAVRRRAICTYLLIYNTAQNSFINLLCYPRDSRHCSDLIYCMRGYR